MVLVNGRTADPSDRIAAGDVVEFQIPEAYAIAASAAPISLDVVDDDEALAVIDNLRDPAVHPDPSPYTAPPSTAIPALGRLLHGRDDLRMSVPQDHRAPRLDLADIDVAVAVDQVLACSPLDKDPPAPDSAPRASQTVPPPRHRVHCALPGRVHH